MTRRRDLLAVAVRIVTILSAVCVVGLGGARNGGAVPLESWGDQINNPTGFKALPEFNNEAERRRSEHAQPAPVACAGRAGQHILR